MPCDSTSLLHIPIIAYLQQFMMMAIKLSLTIREQLTQKPTTIPQCFCRYI